MSSGVMTLDSRTAEPFSAPAPAEETKPAVLDTSIVVAEPKKRSEQMKDLEEELGEDAASFDMTKLKPSAETMSKVKHAAGTAARVAGVTAAAAGVAVVGTGVAGGVAARKAMNTTMNGIESGLTSILMGDMAMSSREEKMANAIQSAKDANDKRKQRMMAMGMPRGGNPGMGGMSL